MVFRRGDEDRIGLCEGPSGPPELTMPARLVASKIAQGAAGGERSSCAAAQNGPAVEIMTDADAEISPLGGG
jgi:hypothetical protein